MSSIDNPAISSKTTATSWDSQASPTQRDSETGASFVQPNRRFSRVSLARGHASVTVPRLVELDAGVEWAGGASEVRHTSRFGTGVAGGPVWGGLSLLGVSEVVTEGKVLDTGMLFVVRLRKVQGCASRGS